MENERLARAALSRLMEPQDAAGLALVQVTGALDALGIATGELSYGPALEQEITVVLAEHGSVTSWAGMAAALKRWAPGFRTLHRNATWLRWNDWAAG